MLLCDHSASPRSLCVSGSGKHVGIGTNGGWIFVLGADGLGRVVGREVTGLPVTMVAFSPEVEAESSACDVVGAWLWQSAACANRAAPSNSVTQLLNYCEPA